MKTDPRSKREKKSSITEAGDPRRRLKSDPFKLTEEELEEFRLSEKLHKEQMKPMHDFEPMDPDTLLQVGTITTTYAPMIAPCLLLSRPKCPSSSRLRSLCSKLKVSATTHTSLSNNRLEKQPQGGRADEYLSVTLINGQGLNGNLPQDQRVPNHRGCS